MISEDIISNIYKHIQDDKSRKIFRHRVLYSLFSEKQDEIEVLKSG